MLQPYFEGERTPNLPDATATLFGMTLASTTRENLARAAIEGMLCGLADGLDAVIAARASAAARCLLIGGAAAATRRSRRRGAGVRRAGRGARARRVRRPRRGGAGRLGALTGERPTWPREVVSRVAADPQPIIRAQYAEAAASVDSQRPPRPGH